MFKINLFEVIKSLSISLMVVALHNPSAFSMENSEVKEGYSAISKNLREPFAPLIREPFAPLILNHGVPSADFKKELSPISSAILEKNTDSLIGSSYSQPIFISAYLHGGKSITLGAQLDIKEIQTYDYIALSSHYPNDARDYLAHCWDWVINLLEQEYETPEKYRKDRDYHVFYGRYNTDRGEYQIVKVEKFLKNKWIQDNRRHFDNLTLSQIAIPGSHNSGTFRINTQTPIADNYVQCQSLTFYEQLMMGNRYLDCRLTYWSNYEEHFWFGHDRWNTKVKLKDLIDDVSIFLSENTEEIVILDFSHFLDSDNDYRRLDSNEKLDEFYNRLNNLFKYFISDSRQTIGNLIREDKRLLILTDEPHLNRQYNLGGSINNYGGWPNKYWANDLIEFLDNEFKYAKDYKENNSLSLFQAILTPNQDDGGPIPASVWRLSNRMYPSVNKQLLINQDWFNKVNVMFTDYSSNIMAQILIYINKGRPSETRGY